MSNVLRIVLTGFATLSSAVLSLLLCYLAAVGFFWPRGFADAKSALLPLLAPGAGIVGGAVALLTFLRLTDTWLNSHRVEATKLKLSRLNDLFSTIAEALAHEEWALTLAPPPHLEKALDARLDSSKLPVSNNGPIAQRLLSLGLRANTDPYLDEDIRTRAFVWTNAVVASLRKATTAAVDHALRTQQGANPPPNFRKMLASANLSYRLKLSEAHRDAQEALDEFRAAAGRYIDEVGQVPKAPSKGRYELRSKEDLQAIREAVEGEAP